MRKYIVLEKYSRNDVPYSTACI